MATSDVFHGVGAPLAVLGALVAVWAVVRETELLLASMSDAGLVFVGLSAVVAGIATAAHGWR
ncbi:MAG: hypothetical protein ABEH77_02635 [Halobacteriaceae archaeon]